MSDKTGSGRGRLKQIARQWFARVEQAQAHCRQALEHQRRMIDELDQARIDEADGSFVVAKAHRATAIALNELVRCQEVLLKLALRREVPPPHEDDKLLI